MKKPIMRALTDAESEHCAKLLRRTGETGLSALLGFNEGTLWGWIKKERWPAPSIEQMMSLTLEEVPRKTKPQRPKPPRSSRLQSSLTRSELLYYRED